jgi:histone deacetylase 1/2
MGSDQVHAANGIGMEIGHIGHSTLQSPTSSLHLNNILHVPTASKSLVSVHRLSRDNNAYLEFYPDRFFVKEQQTKKILHTGRCEGGLYPFKSSFNKQGLGVTKLSSSLWHSRLGHPSTTTVHQVISQHNLPFVKDLNNPMCDACQQGKHHQLPYPRSSSASTSPMELIFSDVWGPAPISVGKHAYYVSFIDYYSKFVWIYLIRQKSEVFRCFQDFQNLVERQFNCKIHSVQMDWGGEYQTLHAFFQRIGITHLVSCPYAHQQNGSAERKHRHIVDMVLALLAHASIPLKFWDEAFLTAVFLINRLPSKVIANQSPFERLYGKTPDYTFLRTFGCVVWPNLRPFNST